MRYIFILFIALFSVTGYAQDSTAIDSIRQNKRPIKEVKIWRNGVQYDANDIDVVIAFDNCESSATIYYKLSDSTGAIVADGNITIAGADYREWVAKPFHNRTATNYAMKHLKLQETARRRAIRTAKAAATVTQ